MALQARAIQSGIQAADMLFNGDTATFNAVYSEHSRRIAAANQKNTAEKNIAAIKGEKILTDAGIQIKQDQAAAMAKVNAAVSGSSGQSTKDVVYQTEANESFALARNRANTEQNIESELAKINTAQAALLAVEDSSKKSFIGGIADIAGSIDAQDIKNFEAFMSGEEDASTAELGTGNHPDDYKNLQNWGG